MTTASRGEENTTEEAISPIEGTTIIDGRITATKRCGDNGGDQTAERKSNEHARREVVFMIIHGDKVLTTRPKEVNKLSALTTTSLNLGHMDNWKTKIKIRVFELFGIDVPD